MKIKSGDIIMQNKIFLWIVLSTGLILLIPFLGNWPWTLGDFIVASTLLVGFSSLFVLAGRKIRSTKNRIIIGIVVAVTFLYIWAELAVGIFTNWGS